MLNLLLAIIYIIDIGTILYMIFKEKRVATSVVAWALILIVLPVAGLVIYVLIGRQVNQSKMFKVDEAEALTYEHYKAKAVAKRFKALGIKHHKNYEMINCLENMSYAPFRMHNTTALYIDGKEMFEELKARLKAAKRSEERRVGKEC